MREITCSNERRGRWRRRVSCHAMRHQGHVGRRGKPELAHVLLDGGFAVLHELPGAHQCACHVLHRRVVA
jgi:hypothetical protein